MTMIFFVEAVRSSVSCLLFKVQSQRFFLDPVPEAQVTKNCNLHILGARALLRYLKFYMQ